MSSNAPKGSKSVAMVATASVDGYLRNASKRQRVPAAEGGRGTRRKMAMVTSASARASTVDAEPPTTTEPADGMAADVDEWDEVELPTTLPSVKKQEVGEEGGVVKTNTVEEILTDDVKAEQRESLPVVKAEDCPSVATPLTTLASTAGNLFVKAELINVDDEQANGAPAMDGARLPLVGQPRSADTWRLRDPAYEAMIEQRDLLAAQRRSERIHRICASFFVLLVVLFRARMVWRLAGHPGLSKALLRLHTTEPQSHAKVARTEAGTSNSGSRYVFLTAVQEAKSLVAESTQPQFRKLTLAPAWVVCSKDVVKSKTSTAIKTLIDAINHYFRLVIRTGEANNAADAPASSTTATGPVAELDFSDWAAPLTPRYLRATLASLHRQVDASAPVELVHPVYFSFLFLALARLAGLRCRLVVAKQAKRPKEKAGAAGTEDCISHSDSLHGEVEGDAAAENEEEDDGASTIPRQPLRKLSIYEERTPRKSAEGDTTTKKGAKRGRAADKDDSGGEMRSKKLPTSCFWVEVWSAERESFLSVNPCQGCSTLWGPPYVFSVAGNVAVDATPRYSSMFSHAYLYGRRLGTCQQHRFLWHDKLAWDDNRELSDVLLTSFNVDAAHTSALIQRQLQREKKQLHSLTYLEVVPTTLTALHHHPLYVIESDLARHEGVFPKDASTTVGSVKGHIVYKRSAIVSMRSRDGWLREGRSLLTEDQVPYKVVPPPASRPFVAASTFFGRWQTKPFEPLPLVAGDPPSIPHHGRTSWYVLLDKPPPSGIVHLRQPQIVRVARRMRLDFGLAVVGFVRRRTDEHRRGHWETVFDGIAVRAMDSAALVHAYEEWMELVQEQEAAKRRQRAFHWWLLLSQRLLSMKRLQDQYARGLQVEEMPLH